MFDASFGNSATFTKVMVFTGMCLSMGEGSAIPACLAGGILACLAAGLQRVGCYPSMHCRWHSSMACSMSRGGGCLPAPGGSAPRGLPLGVCPGVCSQGSAPGGGVWRPPPPRKKTATVADGTHPTGMYSCVIRLFAEHKVYGIHFPSLYNNHPSQSAKSFTPDFFYNKYCYVEIFADPGGAKDAPPPSPSPAGSTFLHFKTVFGKKNCKMRTTWDLAPPPQKNSQIRQCGITKRFCSKQQNSTIYVQCVIELFILSTSTEVFVWFM